MDIEALGNFAQLYKTYAFFVEFHIVDSYTENLIKLANEQHAASLQLLTYCREAIANESDLITLAATRVPEPTAHPELQRFVQVCADAEKCLQHIATRDERLVERKSSSQIKDKKLYEVKILSQHIEKLAREANVIDLVDIGAGQGYLARELANRDFRVIAVERDAKQIHGSISKSTIATVQNLSTIQVDLTPHLDTNSFDSLVGKEKYLLYSLHACGNLSDTMLRLFAESDKARAIVNVGCCYNHIDVASFPSSSKLGTTLDLSIQTRSSFMTACQCSSRWSEHNGESAYSTFKLNHYRAMLQVLLKQQGQHNMRIGPLSKGATSNFSAYVAAGFAKLELPSPPAAEIAQVVSQFEGQRIQLSTLWTLRALMGSVVEVLILADRYWYLKERLGTTASVTLAPVFDRNKSPRNMAIVGVKVAGDHR